MRCQKFFKCKLCFLKLSLRKYPKADLYRVLASPSGNNRFRFLAEPTFILDNDFRFGLAVLLASTGLLEDWICFLARSSRLIYPRTPA